MAQRTAQHNLELGFEKNAIWNGGENSRQNPKFSWTKQTIQAQ